MTSTLLDKSELIIAHSILKMDHLNFFLRPIAILHMNIAQFWKRRTPDHKIFRSYQILGIKIWLLLAEQFYAIKR